jgi:hypothetical protein
VAGAEGLRHKLDAAKRHTFCGCLSRVFSSCSQPNWHDPAPRAPPLSLHLNYRNDCVIISCALISSPQGGYMVHAAHASTASTPPPLPTHHFLIPLRGINTARNSPETNALKFSNRLKTANCSARFSRVLRPQNHESPVAGHGSRFTTHRSLLTNHVFLIASRPNIKNRRKSLKTNNSDPS